MEPDEELSTDTLRSVSGVVDTSTLLVFTGVSNCAVTVDLLSMV